MMVSLCVAVHGPEAPLDCFYIVAVRSAELPRGGDPSVSLTVVLHRHTLLTTECDSLKSFPPKLSLYFGFFIAPLFFWGLFFYSMSVIQ